MTDLVVIGAGTAGLTAAIYGVRAGLTVEVLEQKIYGGQIITTSSVENYPGMPGVSGADFATALYQQAKELGASISFQPIKEARLEGQPKVLVTGQREYQAKSVILATGANPRKLGCLGEEQYIGSGVSYCATCDGAFHKGKDVVIVGGGNTAIEDAQVLSGLCRKVYIVHRRSQFRAEKRTVERLRRKENIEWITDAAVEEILGGQNVESVILRSLKDGSTRELSVSGVFVAIGSEPDNQLFASQIQLDAQGYIIAGEDCVTNLPGVFAAGDTRTKKVRQIVTAAADGAVAALAASEYIAKREEDGKDG